jgi:hypothetical protein
MKMRTGAVWLLVGPRRFRLHRLREGMAKTVAWLIAHRGELWQVKFN